MRNIRAEVTKFVPTAVKIRRNPASKPKLKPKTTPATIEDDDEQAQPKPLQGPTKDAVYASFMSEMEGFL